jgi:thioredoxin reductase (NADPH)
VCSYGHAAPRNIAEVRPTIVLCCRDLETRADVERELVERYGAHYAIVVCVLPEDLLPRMRGLLAAGAEVALVLAAVNRADVHDIEALAAVRALDPMTSRVVAVRWGDWETMHPLFEALATGRIDHYVRQPVQSADEEFHHSVTGFLNEWRTRRGGGYEAARVVGEQWSARSQELRDMASRNGIPVGFYDATSETGQRMLRGLSVGPEDLPVVTLLFGPHEQTLLNPTDAELADAFGVARPVPATEMFDVAVVGAGPAGLAAAVYASSEGLRTVVIERQAIGGQAGTSSLIRNYLGFSQGVSGRQLAREAWQQAWLFGTTFVFMRQVEDLSSTDGRYRLRLSDGASVNARSLVVATGASYRRLDVPTLEELQGRGVFYGAGVSEAPAMHGQNVFIVGGGNSAGQAAMDLAKWAAQVTILVRGRSLAQSMSDYLVREINACENVDVMHGVRVVGCSGIDYLQSLVLEDSEAGDRRDVPANALFVLIGSEPQAVWLGESVARDAWGFILTGTDVSSDARAGWPLDRPPMPLETSQPGVLAAGDVRHGSAKRVASAVGEGAATIPQIHQYLTANAL